MRNRRTQAEDTTAIRTRILEDLARRSLRLAPPAGALMGVLGIAAPAHAAAEPPICSTSFDPYQASAEVLKECGIKSYPLQSKVEHPDGSADYEFLVDGDKTVIHAPPPGWKPLNASAAERARFGIPPEPTDAQKRAIWREALERITFAAPPPALLQVPVYNPPPPGPGAPSSTGSAAPNSSGGSGSGGSTANATSTSQWAGMIDYNNEYTEADGAYTQTGDNGASCANNHESTWVGVSNPNVVAQNGTDVGGQAWWEITAPPPNVSPEVDINNFPVTPGQTVFVKTWYQNGSYNFKWYNDSTGQSYPTVSVSYPQISPAQADFLVERPNVFNGSSWVASNLANFGSESWAQTDANGQLGNTWTNDTWNMYDNLNLEMASSSGFTGSSGQSSQVWKRCS